MSDVAIMGVGLTVFFIVTLLSLQYGYAVFGRWYDEDTAQEMRRREEQNALDRSEGRTESERASTDISHDRPEDLVDTPTT